MVALNEKRPRGVATPGAAGSRRHEGSYPTRRELQSLGEQFAARWTDAAVRFASGFFRSLTDPPLPAIAQVIEAAREDIARLGAGDFPTREHWNLAALLCAFAEHGLTPTPDRILRAAQLASFELPTGGGDQVAELRAVLCCECSAAGIGSWASELCRCGRKAQQVRRLWRVLADYLRDDIDTAPTATPIIVRRVARRRSA